MPLESGFYEACARKKKKMPHPYGHMMLFEIFTPYPLSATNNFLFGYHGENKCRAITVFTHFASPILCGVAQKLLIAFEFSNLLQWIFGKVCTHLSTRNVQIQ